MSDFGYGITLVVVSIIAGLLLVLYPVQPAKAQWAGPIWTSYTYGGHKYVLVKYVDSIAVTHDESCTVR